MSRALLKLGLSGVVLEAGCVWIWVMSPQLTAIYNPEFTLQFFERLPGLHLVLGGALGVLGPTGEPTQDVNGMVVKLEVGLVLMIIGYVAALVALGSDRSTKSAVWLILGFALAFRLTLVMLPGLFSTDILSYAMYGRIAGVYGQNPYVLPPSSFADDAFLAWVFPFWRDQPSVYGAAWTDFSWLLSRLTGGTSNFDQVMVYRLSLGALEVATLGLLWWLLRRLEPEGSPRALVTAWAMYAWNPLVLFDLVGSAHNDAAMLALLLVGVALIGSQPAPQRAGHSNGYWVLGLMAMTLGALVKFATGIVVPLWAVAWAAQGESKKKRLVRLAAGLGLPLALALVLWWPWVQTSLALRPLSEAAGGRLVVNSAPDLVALTVADQLLTPAGMDPEAAQAAARFWTRAVTRALFVVYLGWEMWRLWVVAAACVGRAAELAALRASTRVLLVLPLVVMTWVWSWYFSWSLVLAALLGRRSRLARLVITYTVFALPLVYAHQYLNERFSGVFVIAFALVPLVSLLAGRARRKESVAPGSS